MAKATGDRGQMYMEIREDKRRYVADATEDKGQMFCKQTTKHTSFISFYLPISPLIYF